MKIPLLLTTVLKRKVYKTYQKERDLVLFKGDCLNLLKKIPDNTVALTITSPPYFMGKEYDYSHKIEDFITDHRKILKEVVRVTKKGGSICWQVGYHVKNGYAMPLDYYVYDILKDEKEISLKNRIIWTYGHGLHSSNRFSGRHEVILWFTKGKDHYFDLDAVRVPQKYPGKRYYKGNKKGEFSGNPSGKNPGDVWDIPNVKANHVEKTGHPCQFPIALANRLIKSLCPRGGYVLDPYMGSGSTAASAIINGRKFIGSELVDSYYKIALNRCKDAVRGELLYRSEDKPIFKPTPNMSVARKPKSFK